MLTKEEYEKTVSRMCYDYRTCLECPLSEIRDFCIHGGSILTLLTAIENWAEEHNLNTGDTEC